MLRARDQRQVAKSADSLAGIDENAFSDDLMVEGNVDQRETAIGAR